MKPIQLLIPKNKKYSILFFVIISIISIFFSIGLFNIETDTDITKLLPDNVEVGYEREKILPASFEGERNRNRVDFLIEGKMVLEVKAKRFISKEEYYQLKRYLSVLNKKLGILVNFRQKFVHPKRVLNASADE